MQKKSLGVTEELLIFNKKKDYFFSAVLGICTEM